MIRCATKRMRSVFTIWYNASEKQFSGGHHISYTVPYSFRNPLTNAPHWQKQPTCKEQLRRHKGIIICDNGCDALNERSRVNGAFGCREIVEGFLRKHAHILWVLVMRIAQDYGFSRGGNITIKPQLYWNPGCDKLLFRDTVSALERMLAHLPLPEVSPVNAAHWLNGKNGKLGRPLGGYSMKGKTIKISARALTELLAGKVTQQRFLEDHGIKSHQSNPELSGLPFFEQQLNNGNTLKNVFVEHEEHRDDDWIVLEYEGPDPAVSPYRVPQ